MNFTTDVVDRARPDRTALVVLDDRGRREIPFGEVADRTSRLAGSLAERGVRRGDVVMTLVGSRPEWVYAMLACFRIGAIVLPCNEQLRARDLAARMAATAPVLVVADARNLGQLSASGFGGEVMPVPDDSLYDAEPAAAVDLAGDDPSLILFTSGTSGTAKPIRHGHRFVTGQSVQAEHWFGARPGEVSWCTAASGWSKSARNVFVTPWLRGSAALLEDHRFDPGRRVETILRENVNALCMSPTEYRAIAKTVDVPPLPSLRSAVAAGEPLNPEIILRWREATGVEIRDGYGQTETGHTVGMPPGEPVRPGAMGKPLPGFRVWVEDGEICVDPGTVPTFFLDGGDGVWRTGDRAHEDEDGYLWFDGRADDVIISAGYRIGPFEVESALLSHPAVVEAAAVAAPDDVRGSVVRAVVVLRSGRDPSDALARELQEHVREQTAPYKYPRIVEFAASLPRTPSGKIKRAELRRAGPGRQGPSG